MTTRALRFLVLVLALMLLETLALYLVLRYALPAASPTLVLLLAGVFFLLIPLNILIAWLLTMRGRKLE